MSRKVFLEERIPLSFTEAHTIINDGLTILSVESDNNKEMENTEGIPTGITEEHKGLNDCLTLIYKESDNNREMANTK